MRAAWRWACRSTTWLLRAADGGALYGGSVPTADTLFHRLVRTPGGRDATDQLAPEVRDRVGRNGLLQVAADALQNVGDQVVNAKTVLPWLLSTLGAPGALLGLLVPI